VCRCVSVCVCVCVCVCVSVCVGVCERVVSERAGKRVREKEKDTGHTPHTRTQATGWRDVAPEAGVLRTSHTTNNNHN
jgi:hypothetical protein